MALLAGWNVELLLDSIIEASHQGRCNALIDTGALITGLTNQEAPVLGIVGWWVGGGQTLYGQVRMMGFCHCRWGREQREVQC